MAKKSVIERNKKRIRLYNKYRFIREELKKQVRNESLSLEKRLEAQKKLSELPRNSSRTRIRNRCHVTGRGRGYLGFFGISRIVFREYASFGLLPGVKKASW